MISRQGTDDEITQEMLMAILNYNPASGELKWKHPKRTSEVFKNGAKTVGIYGKTRRPHDIVWCYVYGEWPKMCVEHKDGDTTNLKFNNLQLSDRVRPRVVGAPQGTKKTRRDINTIKNGSWEDRNYRCPPPATGGFQELFGEHN